MRHFAKILILVFATLSFAQFSPDTSQWYQIIFAHSNLCLRPTNAQLGNNVVIEQTTIDSKDTTQLWRFKASTTPGYYYITNKNGKVMNVCGTTAGSSVVTTGNYKADNQKLRLTQSAFFGTYFISDYRSVKSATNMTFDAKGGCTTPGTKVQIYTKNACVYANQVVRLQPVGSTSRLVFWNTLGSATEITQSKVGLNGICKGGSFVPGKFGNAYQATVLQDTLVSFPETVLSADSGCIEFWAKLTGYSGDWQGGYNPGLFLTRIGTNLQFTYNDGAGNNGLCGTFGGNPDIVSATGGRQWSFEDALGDVSAWHHYALVWNNKGIKQLGNVPVETVPWPDNVITMQLCRSAIFLDGVLKSNQWTDYAVPFPTPQATNKLYLVFNEYKKFQGAVAIDNIKAWSYSKVDFSDRFVE